MKALSLGRDLIERRRAWFFAPLSWIWAIVVFIKNILYDRKWIKQKRVPCTVVSIGNLVAGGTGKTPFVQHIAAAFASKKIGVVSRIYRKIPDEAMLLKRRLPHAKIYAGKNKTLLAQQAAREGVDLILIDDGFQHRKLFRDIDIVLLRGDDPFGKGHYLPWGFLRDSPSRLRQADVVFVMGRDFRHGSVRILKENEEEIFSIQGWKVGLFCGIGNPNSFKKSVADLGAEIVAEWILADHEAPSSCGLKRFETRCKTLGVRALITTEKDFIKRPRSSLPIIFIEIEIEWLEGKEKWEKLIAKIDQKIDNAFAYDRINKN